MRLVIAGYYGFANAGDEAILAAMLADLRGRVPQAAITVVSGDPAATTAAHGVPAVLFTDIGALVEAVRGADLLILGGGGLFQDYWGVETGTLLSPWHGGLSYFAGLPLLASLVETPTMIYAAGVGPLLGDEGRLFTRYAFAQSAGATVRDRGSLDELKAAGADVSNVTVTADPAILIRPDDSPAVRASLRGLARPLVGVALRGWDVGVDPERWEGEVAQALDRVLAARGGTAVFIPFQVLPGGGVDDVEVAGRVRGRMRGDARVIDVRLSAAETAALVAGCDAVVAMRLHSAVFAVAAGVPATALVYDPKVRRFADEAGLGDHAVEIAAVSADALARHVESALDAGPDLRSRLRAHAAALGERARGNGRRVAELATGARVPAPPADTTAMLRRAALGMVTTGAERMAELRAQMARREDVIARRDAAIAHLRGEVTNRDERLAAHAEVITFLEKEVKGRDEQIAWLKAEEQKLQAIYASNLWRYGQRYQRARQRVALLGQPRRMAEAVGRRVLPSSAKRALRRYWTPLPPPAMEPASAPSPASEVPARTLPARLPEKHDVVCFSIIDWEFRWQRPQQVMSRFAEQGHRVFFLSTSRFLKGNGKPYEVVPLRENVWEVRISTPRAIDVYSGELAAGVPEAVVDALRALRADFHMTCAVSVVQVATWAAAALLARDRLGWRVAYDCMDEWDNFPGMRKALLEQEERLVGDADLLIVTGQKLWDKWHGHNANTVLARNGADFDHFQRPPASAVLEGVQGPVVGYFGAVADWFDLALMEGLARERPQYTFVLVGGIFDVPVAKLKAMPNVRIEGQRPYALMPAYLRRFDACIIPFQVNPITEATDPVKFYEYVSQGKPVVATAMAELAPYREYLYIAEDHDDFLAKVDLAVAENDPALRARRVALARENTWQARIEIIEGGIRRAHPRASVVVVSYFNLDFTRRCLESVLRNSVYPSFEVIVVDNASTDGTPEYLREMAARHPDTIRIVLNDRNLGFAKANNQGLAIATGDRLVLLNNDTVVPNGWLPKLLRHLERPEIGLLVAVTNFSGNESKIAVTYGSDLGLMEEFAARYTREHEGQLFDIKVAAMYCVAFRREAYEKVGPLDEKFGMGMFEDDDYSHRMRLAGYRVVCAEDAFVHHYGQASFKKLSPSEYQAIWDRNQKYYEEKWGVAWQAHTPRR
jgi:polysaccharide pyruvyl transferase CsaB